MRKNGTNYPKYLNKYGSKKQEGAEQKTTNLNYYYLRKEEK
jgi:hypothetical protein